MAKFRKKPAEIEAFQMTQQNRIDNSEWPNWLNQAWNMEPGDVGSVWPVGYPESDGTDQVVIATLEGVMTVAFNDWIIRGVKGELYACKPDIFEQTYEPVP